MHSQFLVRGLGLFLIVFFDSFVDSIPTGGPESVWIPMSDMPSPRTSANVVSIGPYAFIIGGTTNPAYDDCRESFKNRSSGLGCNESFAKDIVPVNLHENVYLNSVGNLSEGIQGRSFVATLHQKVFICYACSWSLIGMSSATLMKLDVLPNERFRESPQTPLPQPRRGTTVVAFPPDLLFFVGGVADSPTASLDVLFFNVSEENGTYVSPLTQGEPPQDICDCSGVASHDTLFLMNCLNCTSQMEVDFIFKLYIPTWTWLIPFDLRAHSQAPRIPQIGASPAVAMAQFATSIWPDGYDSPNTVMYDMVLNTVLNYPVGMLPEKVRHSAALSVGDRFFLFGGNSYANPSRASALVATVPLLPRQRMRVFPRNPTFGEMLTVYSFSCSAAESVRISSTPSCDTFISSVPAEKCSERMSFNTSAIPADVECFWLCVTQGSCGNGTQPCPINVASQADCNWQGCCWTEEGECFASQPGGGNSEYWYAAGLDPVCFSLPSTTLPPLTVSPPTMAPSTTDVPANHAAIAIGN